MLLALNLGLYLYREKFGITEILAVRLSLASAGVWWGLFTLIPLKALRNRPAERSPPANRKHHRIRVQADLPHADRRCESIRKR